MDIPLLTTSVLVALLGAAYVGVAILAVLQILRSDHDLLVRGLWTVAVVIAPFLGSLAWFLLGRPGGRAVTSGRLSRRRVGAGR
jgi:membrane protein DedA with SNARE-associated domain